MNWETYQSHSIGNLSQQDLAWLNALIISKVVIAILLMSRFGLRIGEALVGVTSHLFAYLLEGQGMSWLRHGRIGLSGDMALEGGLIALSHSD